MKKLLPAFVSLLFCTLVFSGCSTGATKAGREMAQSGDKNFYVDVPEGITMEKIHGAIVYALVDRGWSVTSDAEGTVSAELDRLEARKIHGMVTITYTDKLITIADNSVDDKGNPFVPIRWLKYLAQSMDKYMQTAAVSSN